MFGRSKEMIKAYTQAESEGKLVSSFIGMD